ncbi:hypothetical protein Pa4123_11410 [Phytohabitans aurantiacus]|uniref:DUF4350 domain-containing protein n=2 Tax=Phytohabitans aurantiacus TaxID=3016789 RepID=A0ABQ5QNQ5_9ACTN|nr:hypothetical protein Pa4123_11410 [Phytohabitans aurantiacus]
MRMRWLRMAVPLGIAALLLTVTGITYAVEQPDPTDADFLSPASEAPIGGRALADALRAEGVDVHRTTSTLDAIGAAYEGDATLFVPVPGVSHPDYLRMLESLPASTRIVLVDPPARTLDTIAAPVAATGRRWAAKATEPGCALDEARRAGTAAALRQRYEADGERCYDAGLVRTRWSAAELVVIGANEPFRNDRAGEHGNRALAVGLLATKSTVVWLDLHELEEPPAQPVDPPGSEEPERESSEDPSGEGVVGGDPGSGESGEGRSGNGSGQSEGDGDNGAAPPSEGRNPLWDAFPDWFWAILVQLALAALVVAVWRARRLGPPVSEPLPATVRGAETVLGRGRLYRRAKARGPTADILREAARQRTAALLRLEPDDDGEALASAIAAHTGRPRDDVDDLLYGASPETDEELVALAADLDALAHEVGAPPVRTDEGEQR